MTKSTITREESIQAVFDLKVGYTLGLADIETLKRVARMALAAMASESGCLPLDYLQGHKDGLEWAARLAEASHPETGDWLYDDPIELSKAIRKGPDMPPVQPSPVVPGKWIPVSERMPVEFEEVIAFDGDQVYGEAMYSSDDGFTIDGYDPCDRLNLQNVTHWMPLPAAPQEVKP